jgi:hypothetical protein
VIDSIAVSLFPSGSSTWTVNVNVPSRVGVPKISPRLDAERALQLEAARQLAVDDPELERAVAFAALRGQEHAVLRAEVPFGSAVWSITGGAARAMPAVRATSVSAVIRAARRLAINGSSETRGWGSLIATSDRAWSDRD